MRFGAAAVLAGMLAWSGTSLALPVAQLDIGGDNVTYDTATGTVVTTDPMFSLFGYGNTPSANGKTLDMTLDWYLSVSLVPQTAVGTDFGSFNIDGVSYDTNDMSWGIPPLDSLLLQQSSLPPHSVYPTLYTLLDVTWDPTQTRSAINVQDTVGTDPYQNPGSALMFVEWLVNVGNLAQGFNLHFDLFGVSCPAGTAPGDFTSCKVAQFAPFSHDAQTNVPEPATLSLLGLGLLLVGVTARGRRRKRKDAEA